METDSAHVSVHPNVLLTLPNELLTQIFKQYILLYRSDIVSQRTCTADQLSPLRSSQCTLMQVCTLWRDIVKHEPCLWTVIPIVIPRVLPSQRENIHPKAAEFVRRLERRVALARGLSLSLILHDHGNLLLSQQTHVYQRIIALFPCCHSICIYLLLAGHTETSARWASVADFLRPYPQLLELQVGMEIPYDWLQISSNVRPPGLPVGLQKWAARLIANATNLLSLQFTHCILNNMRDGPSTLENLVVPDVRLRIEDLVRMLKHYPRLRGLTLETIRQGYYITPFTHHELTHLTLGNAESGPALIDDEVLNGLSLPALVDFHIVQELNSDTSWPTHTTLAFLSRSRCKLVSYHVQLESSYQAPHVPVFDAVRWRKLLLMQPSLVHLHVLCSRKVGCADMPVDALTMRVDPVCPALEDISLPVFPWQISKTIQDMLEFRCGDMEAGVAKLNACNLDIRGYNAAIDIQKTLAYFEARQFPVSVTRYGRPMLSPWLR